MKNITKISKIALADFYELHTIISKISSNYINDKNNPNMMDKHLELVKTGTAITQKWIDANEPLDW